MSGLWDRIQGEPALVYGFVMAVLQAATTFGLDLTDGQLVSVNTVVLALLSLLVRGEVTPLHNPMSADGQPLMRVG